MDEVFDKARVSARIESVIGILEEKREGIDWLNLPGDLIVSGPTSLSGRSRVCLLGFNPGGETTGRPLRENLEVFPLLPMSDRGIAASWKGGMGRGYERISKILRGVGIEAPYVANLFPLPTTRVPELWACDGKLQRGSHSPATQEQFVQSIWPVHDYLFKDLDPDLIISIGLSGTAFCSVQRILFDVVNGGRGDWNFRPAHWQGLELGSMKYTRIRIGGRERHLVGVTHFSRLGNRHVDLGAAIQRLLEKEIP